MFEAFRAGEIRISDLRLVYRDALLSMRSVAVTVLGEETRLAAAEIQLTRASFGSGWRVLMLCPRCQSRAQVLLARRGMLLCSRCQPRRTRHQMEARRAAWTRLGGREEDRLIRLLTASRSEMHLAEARSSALRLLEADRVRAMVLEERLAELLVVASAEA